MAEPACRATRLGDWPIVAGQPHPRRDIRTGHNTPTGQNGSDGVANYVSALSSEGSIGYLETAYAIEHNMPVASLVNASGNAVQPTSVNDATALEKAILYRRSDPEPDQRLHESAAQRLSGVGLQLLRHPVHPLAGRRPAPGDTCAANNSGTSPFAADKGAALGQFINFMACAGQEKMALLGYSPLPPNLVQEDFNAIGRLNGG